MNTRLVVFVAALLLVSASATEWSAQDDQLFSDDVSVAAGTAVKASVPAPAAGSTVVVNAPVAVPVGVAQVGNDAHVVMAIDHVPVAVESTNPAGSSNVNDLQNAYIRSREAAVAAALQAQQAADAHAKMEADKRAAQDRATQLTSEAAAASAAVKKAAEDAKTAMENGEPIKVLENTLENLRKMASEVRNRLAAAQRDLQNKIQYAETSRQEALRALAESERIARETRLAKRAAAEAERVRQRQIAAQERVRAHNEAIAMIHKNATDAKHNATVAANVQLLEGDLATTRRAIHELKRRILERKARAAAKRRAQLERRLAKARAHAEKIAREISQFNYPIDVAPNRFVNHAVAAAANAAAAHGQAVAVPISDSHVAVAVPANQVAPNMFTHTISPSSSPSSSPSVHILAEQNAVKQELAAVQSNLDAAQQDVKNARAHEEQLNKAVHNKLSPAAFSQVFDATLSSEHVQYA